MIQEYKVITWCDINTLTEKVNLEIKRGWEPIGGIGITVVSSDRLADKYTFYQAMVKRKKGDSDSDYGIMFG